MPWRGWMARWALLLWIHLYPILCRKERSLPLVSALDNIPQPSPLDQRHYSTQRCLSRRKIFVKKMLITGKLTEVINLYYSSRQIFSFFFFFSPYTDRPTRPTRGFFFLSRLEAHNSIPVAVVCNPVNVTEGCAYDRLDHWSIRSFCLVSRTGTVEYIEITVWDILSILFG